MDGVHAERRVFEPREDTEGTEQRVRGGELFEIRKARKPEMDVDYTTEEKGWNAKRLYSLPSSSVPSVPSRGSTPMPLTVPLTAAPPAILALARARIAHPNPVLIGITGPVGAGKSTLARLLSPCILSTDDYLPDYDTLPVDEHDLPDHLDAGLLLENLAALVRGEPATTPIWSFQTHRREGGPHYSAGTHHCLRRHPRPGAAHRPRHARPRLC